MVDNFDINVARRKPNTTMLRPKRPWDVTPLKPSREPLDESEDSVLDAGNTDIVEEPVSIIEPVPEKAPAQKRVKIKKHVFPHAPSFVSTHDELSDSINIHSNFCKLHNDVSDILQGKLSLSAQSVYLRLYRQSYGWNRNWAAESLPKIKDACNMSLQTVRKAIKDLEGLGCIQKVFSDFHKATVYRVYLPSDIGLSNNANVNNAMVNNRGLNTVSPRERHEISSSQNSLSQNNSSQFPDASNFHDDEVQKLVANDIISGGQKNTIQSIYFLGTNTYTLLESGGPLPINIQKYITYTHLSDAVHIIDEFYDSIGFSVVSRALYRKSLIDYFELIKTGFSTDDIRYAVRWTFKNSRTRPESFSLIKHTMHLAMEDLIQDLKHVSGKKDEAERRQELLKQRSEWEVEEEETNFNDEEYDVWETVVEDLRETVGGRSFTAFILPLKLVSVEGDRVVVSAPPDSMSWVKDHFIDRIEEAYQTRTGKRVAVEVR